MRQVRSCHRAGLELGPRPPRRVKDPVRRTGARCVQPGHGDPCRQENEPAVVKVVTAWRRALRELGAEDTALGASALALARRLDDPATSAQSSAAIGRELRETLALLEVKAEPEQADRMTGYEQGLRVAG